MGNAFIAGLKNEAPRGRDITNEDRNSEVSQKGTQRGAEGSEFSYIMQHFALDFKPKEIRSFNVQSFHKRPVSHFQPQVHLCG